MEELDVRRWVLPFYLDFAHGNFVNTQYRYSVGLPKTCSWEEWRELLRRELRDITPEIVGDLVMDGDWRTQICGAYFCGLKRWDEFTVPLGHRLVAKRNMTSTQGYAFALARMPSHASANTLCGYLSRVGRPQDTTHWYGQDLEWVVAALQWVDEQMGTHRLEPYIGSLNLFHQKERFERITKQYREIPKRAASAPYVSEKRVEEMLEQKERELDTYYLPDSGKRQSPWFWKLMTFCQEHF